MSEHSNSKKSRRRFLADMLFLGGGLTAAGLLAKAQMAPEVEPQIAGKVAAPVKNCPPTPSGPVPGEAVAVQAHEPRPEPSVAPPTPDPGAAGDAVLPGPMLEVEPNPRGGRVPPRPHPESQR